MANNGWDVFLSKKRSHGDKDLSDADPAQTSQKRQKLASNEVSAKPKPARSDLASLFPNLTKLSQVSTSKAASSSKASKKILTNIGSSQSSSHFSSLPLTRNEKRKDENGKFWGPSNPGISAGLKKRNLLKKHSGNLQKVARVAFKNQVKYKFISKKKLSDDSKSEISINGSQCEEEALNNERECNRIGESNFKFSEPESFKLKEISSICNQINEEQSTQQSLMVRNSVGMTRQCSSSPSLSANQVVYGKSKPAKILPENKIDFSMKDVQNSVPTMKREELVKIPKQYPSRISARDKSGFNSDSSSLDDIENKQSFNFIGDGKEQKSTSDKLLKKEDSNSPVLNEEAPTEPKLTAEFAKAAVHSEGCVKQNTVANSVQSSAKVFDDDDDAVINDILLKYGDVLPKAIKLLGDFYGLAYPKLGDAVSITPASKASIIEKRTEKLCSSPTMPRVDLDTGENTFTISPIVKSEPSSLEPQVLIHEPDCTSSACDFGDVVVSDHEVYSDEESSEEELEGKDYRGMEYIRNIRRHIGVTQYSPASIHKPSGEVIHSSYVLKSSGGPKNTRLTSDVKISNGTHLTADHGSQESTVCQPGMLVSSSGKVTLSGRPAISLTPIRRSYSSITTKSILNLQKLHATNDCETLDPSNTKLSSFNSNSNNSPSDDKSRVLAPSCAGTCEVSSGVDKHGSSVSALHCDQPMSDWELNDTAGRARIKTPISLGDCQSSAPNYFVACPSPSSSDTSSASTTSNGLPVVQDSSDGAPPTRSAVNCNSSSNSTTVASSEPSSLTSDSSEPIKRILLSNPARSKLKTGAPGLETSDPPNSSSVTLPSSCATSLPSQIFLVQPPYTPGAPKPPLLLIRANNIADVQNLFRTKQLTFSSSTSISSTTSTVTNSITTATMFPSGSCIDKSNKRVPGDVNVSCSFSSKKMPTLAPYLQKEDSKTCIGNSKETGGKTCKSTPNDLGFELFPSIKPLSIVLKPSDIVDLKGKTTVNLNDLNDKNKNKLNCIRKTSINPTVSLSSSSPSNLERTSMRSSISPQLPHEEEGESHVIPSSPTYILPTRCSVSPDRSPTLCVEPAPSPPPNSNDMPATEANLSHVPYSSSNDDVASSESFQEIYIKDELVCDIDSADCNVSLGNVESPQYDVTLERDEIRDSSIDHGNFHLNHPSRYPEENGMENIRNTYDRSVLKTIGTTSPSSLSRVKRSAVLNTAILRKSHLLENISDPLALPTSAACVQPEDKCSAGTDCVTTANAANKSDSFPAGSSFEIVLNKGISKPLSSSSNLPKQQLILPKPILLPFFPISKAVPQSSEESSCTTTLFIPNVTSSVSLASATISSSSKPPTTGPQSPPILSPSVFSSGLPSAISPMSDDGLDIPNLASLVVDEAPELDHAEPPSSSQVPVPGPRLTVKTPEELIAPSNDREKRLSSPEKWKGDKTGSSKMNKLSASKQPMISKMFNSDIYLDYNATTPMAETVQDVIMKTLKKNWANPSSSYKYGVKAKKVVDKARKRVASLIGCREENIVFTSGGTESNNLAIHSAIEHYLAWVTEHHWSNHDVFKRPHVITTNLEHDSVTRALHSYDDIDLTVLGWRGMMEELPKRLQPNTCLISIMLANNETGIILPVAEIARKQREEISKMRMLNNYFPLLIHTDASQVVGKQNVSVDDLGVDYLTLTGHKFYGPRVGALYVRENANGFLPVYPLFYGGGQERGIRPGTENTAMIAGLGAACKLALENMAEFTTKQKRIRAYLETSLKQRFGHEVKFNCLEPCESENPDNCAAAHLSLGGAGSALIFPRIPNTTSVAFNHSRVTAKAILALCPNVMMSVGAACHSSDSVSYENSILRHHGVCSYHAARTLRLSVGRDTSAAEVDAAVAILQAAFKILVRSDSAAAPEASLCSTVVAPSMSEMIKLRKLHQLMNAVNQEGSNAQDEKPESAGEESSAEESDS